MAKDVAARAVRRAKKRGATPRVIKALVEAGLVESNMEHDRYSKPGSGDRDSVGFLQQRPSQGWGPPGESVERDTDQFLAKAMKLNRGFKGSAGQLAQQVQRSAFPGRYAQRGVEAEKIIRELLGGTGRSSPAPGAGSSVSSKITPGVDRSGDRRALMAQYLLSDEQHKPGGLLGLKGQLDLVQDTPATATVTRTTRRSNQPGSPARGGKASGRLLELFHDPGINLDNGKRIGPIGGHGKHVHAAFSTPGAVIEAARLAKKMGLHVGENPAWDKVDPVHTEGSFHYQRFKNRPKIGKAIDVSGDPKKLARYNRLLARRFS